MLAVLLRHSMLNYNRDRRSCVTKLLPIKFMIDVLLLLVIVFERVVLDSLFFRLILHACALLPI